MTRDAVQAFQQLDNFVRFLDVSCVPDYAFRNFQVPNPGLQSIQKARDEYGV